MQYRNLLDVSGIIILFIGFVFAFLPHVYHQKFGFSESSHLIHVIYGMVLVIVALAILIYNNKALENRRLFWHQKRKRAS